VSWKAAGSSSSRTLGQTRYRSVMTSMGEIRVRPIAWARNRRAAAVSRRAERYVDDLAELVDGPKQVAPGPFHLQVGLVNVPPIADHVLSSPSRLRELRREPLDPPEDAHVVDLDAAFGQELFQSR
jgi:hypothetical protein